MLNFVFPMQSSHEEAGYVQFSPKKNGIFLVVHRSQEDAAPSRTFLSHKPK